MSKQRDLFQFVTHFWARVNRRGPDECWPWTGSSAPQGYGQLGWTDPETHIKQALRAHRAAYWLTHGPVPDGLCVCHRCDNPPCCNPAHLFVGTFAENNRDRKEKGRNGSPAFTGFSTDPPRGEKNRHAKVTPAQVAELRRHYLAGTLQQRRAAQALGVHFTTINRIVRHKQWTHLV